MLLAPTPVVVGGAGAAYDPAWGRLPPAAAADQKEMEPEPQPEAEGPPPLLVRNMVSIPKLGPDGTVFDVLGALE